MSEDLEGRLRAIVRRAPGLLPVLEAVRELRLPEWAVGAGLLRSAVWDDLHGYDTPTAVPDVDVLYFDPHDLSHATEEEAETRLASAVPEHRWDVKNQARVHLWYPRKFGRAIAPLRSVEEGLTSWAETATAVAVRLEADNRIAILAPFGLEDLFALRLRPNHRWASRETAMARAADKGWLERWPRLRWS